MGILHKKIIDGSNKITLKYIKIVYAHSRWIIFCYVRDMRINYNDYTFTESIIDVLISIYVEVVCLPCKIKA